MVIVIATVIYSLVALTILRIFAEAQFFIQGQRELSRIHARKRAVQLGVVIRGAPRTDPRL